MVVGRMREKHDFLVGKRLYQDRSMKVGSGVMMLRAVHNSGNTERSRQP
jgi:hypothetical protein